MPNPVEVVAAIIATRTNVDALADDDLAALIDAMTRVAYDDQVRDVLALALLAELSQAIRATLDRRRATVTPGPRANLLQ